MRTTLFIAALACGGFTIFAATLPQQGPEVQMIVTSADHMAHNPGVLGAADIHIADAVITGFTALAGRGLELYLLIDDSADYAPEQKIGELRRFIAAQPAGVAIGLAYIHEGALRLAEKPTVDHELIGRALRAPAGGRADSPYYALSDLIAGWSGNAVRREVILVTNGICDGADDTDTAVRAAERAGVIVYPVYNPNSDYLTQNWTRVETGLMNLASLGYETGGEAYFIGHTPVFSIAPFLADITEHLANQYLVTFRVDPRPAAGFETIFVEPTGPEREIMKPDRVWVP